MPRKHLLLIFALLLPSASPATSRCTAPSSNTNSTLQATISDLETCVVTCLVAEPKHTATTFDPAQVVSRLWEVFAKDQHVEIQAFQCAGSAWGGWDLSMSHHVLGGDEAKKQCAALANTQSSHSWAIYPMHKADRKCLMNNPKSTKAIVLDYQLSFSELIDEINIHCDTSRDPLGNLNERGQAKLKLETEYIKGVKQTVAQHGGALHSVSSGDPGRIPSCERISLNNLNDPKFGDSKLEFLHKYVAKGIPVVITDATTNWAAHKKWTNQMFRSRFGHRKVTLYVSSRDGWFEGCEDASLWPQVGNGAVVPPQVMQKLRSPNKVVVRPATVEMTMRQFLDILNQHNRTASFYLEYTSLPNAFPELLADFSEPLFHLASKDRLKLEVTNIWFGDGHTLGKLHFDPFDNFLCQVAGQKQVILFDALQNEDLYEGHIREAFLSYNAATGELSRGKLGDSTSMVMSPLDINRPNFTEFPRSENRLHNALNCSISQGEILYLPSFWWHEVQSVPDQDERNVAVNFWYKPLFTKDFPCASCRMHANFDEYDSLLEKLAQM